MPVAVTFTWILGVVPAGAPAIVSQHASYAVNGGPATSIDLGGAVTSYLLPDGHAVGDSITFSVVEDNGSLSPPASLTVTVPPAPPPEAPAAATGLAASYSYS